MDKPRMKGDIIAFEIIEGKAVSVDVWKFQAGYDCFFITTYPDENAETRELTVSDLFIKLSSPNF